MLCRIAAPGVTYGGVGGNEIFASDFLRDEPFGNIAPVAWLGQACAARLDLDPKAVLSIMRYPYRRYVPVRAWRQDLNHQHAARSHCGTQNEWILPRKEVHSDCS
jgi:hypothetical protein